MALLAGLPCGGVASVSVWDIRCLSFFHPCGIWVVPEEYTCVSTHTL